MAKDTILEVKHLKKYFPVKAGLFRKTVGYVKAVDDVNFQIRPGETLGLVGESGCGKTTTGRLVLRAYEATAGEIWFNGANVLTLNHKELFGFRKDVQIIFQDPYGSLNPKMSVANIVGEPLIIHRLVRNRKEKLDKVRKLLADVGLRPEHINRYPHEFSGGQRQRIGIARALAVEPKLIVADEPVSALDVSIQAQVINLLQDLQEQYGLTYLFVAHDLSVVKHISNRIAVMYLGKIVEITHKQDLYATPLHPYTCSLLSAIPITDPRKRDRRKALLKGDVPSPMDPPSGCRFHTRCPQRLDICDQQEPVFMDKSTDHMVACHLYS